MRKEARVTRDAVAHCSAERTEETSHYETSREKRRGEKKVPAAK